MTLINTFAPHDDESGLGYYRRLSRENGVMSWGDLAAAAGTSRNRTAVLGSPDLMASALGLDAAWSEFATAQEQVSRTWSGTRRLHDAVCCSCLSESCHLRQHWEHSYVVACPLHRIQLIDRCPACAERLKPTRSHIEFCACGFDLRTSSATPSTPAQHWLSSLIASGGATSGGIAPRLERPNVPGLSNLVRLLCLGGDPSARSARNRAGSVTSVQEAVEFLRPLDALLDSWPTGFERHVENRLAEGYALARTLNTRLGAWYGGLKKICQNVAFEPFLRVVIQVAAKNFEGALPLDAARHLSVEISDCLLVADVAEIWGVSRSFVVDAIKRGECAHRERMFGRRGHQYEVPKTEVERIASLRLGWISEAEACELAGVSSAVLEHMMAAQVIQSDRKWRSDLFKGGPIERRSLELLHAALAERARGGKRRQGERILWMELTSRRMGDTKAIHDAMRAAASGALVPMVSGRQLGHAGFLKSELAGYFGTPLLESGMSVQQLSKEAGWKWETVSHWIDEGLLGAEKITRRGQVCRVVTPSQMLAFRQTYLPLADLAREMGTKASALAEQLSGIEIVGAQVSSAGVRRGGLIRVADLGRLAASAAKAASL